ncbi:hypothetical protein J2J97_32260 (plasmid) [Rhizobium bangladeshense]|uniref:hypothetical protein n=1 Tax=Rhizobium bangladeshense TaxID=1138189 RepID=UPI001A99385E|nr:hypothetical protein [Rhizobium bangladeshense]QSY98579.1 hypothetical protein J2J97_32260 [Rhizobium bangladeshense]
MTDKVRLERNTSGFLTVVTGGGQIGAQYRSQPLGREDLVHLYDQIVQQFHEWGIHPSQVDARTASLWPQLPAPDAVPVAGRAIQLEDQPIVATVLQPVAAEQTPEWRDVDREPVAGDWVRVVSHDRGVVADLPVLRDTTIGRMYQVSHIDGEGQVCIYDNVNDLACIRYSHGHLQTVEQRAQPDGIVGTVAGEEVVAVPAAQSPTEVWRRINDRPPRIGDYVRITHVPSDVDSGVRVGQIVLVDNDVDIGRWGNDRMWDVDSSFCQYTIWHDGDPNSIQGDLVERVDTGALQGSAPRRRRLIDELPMPTLSATVQGVTRATFRQLFLEHMEEISRVTLEVERDQNSGLVVGDMQRDRDARDEVLRRMRERP